MTYSVFIGFLSNIELDWRNWLFLIFVLWILSVSFSAYIALNESYFRKGDKRNKTKLLLLAVNSIMILILFGIIGFISFIINHLIIVSFISDYRLNEKD